MLLVEEPLHLVHPRVEAAVVVELEHFLLAKRERRPRLVVEVVTIGGDRVESVVAAGQFDDDEDGILPLLDLVGRECGRGEKLGNDRANGEQAAPTDGAGEEIATTVHGDLVFGVC